MKLVDLFEDIGAKKGQKIKVIKDSPIFMDVPTAGPSSRYSHSFKEDDILRIYSIGKTWIVVEAVTPGTGTYKWARGNKVTEFKTKEYKWRITPNDFGRDWFEPIEETVPDFMTDIDQAKDWLATTESFATELKSNGDGTFDAVTVRSKIRNDNRLRIKFRKVEFLDIEKEISNFSDLPDEVIRLYINAGKTLLKDIPFRNSIEMLSLNGQYQDISGLPDLPNLTYLAFSSKKLKSIEGIKKFDKIERVLFIETYVLQKGLLELLSLTHLKNINFQDVRSTELMKALNIIQKYVGQGNSGLIKAQRELIENDLEDFA